MKAVKWLLVIGVMVGCLLPAGLADAAAPGVCNQTTINHGEFSALRVQFYCTLNNSHIDGVTSVPDADILEMNSSTAVGGVTLGSGAQATVTGSTSDAIDAPAALGLSVTRGSVHGSIAGGFDGGPRRKLTVSQADVHGRVQWTGQFEPPRQYESALISGDTIGGDLELHKLAVTIEHTTIGGDLLLLSSVQVAQLCSVHILGDATVAYNYTGTFLGGYAAGQTCTGPMIVTIDGSLTISKNTGGVLLDHVVVNGDLNCSGNSDRPIIRYAIVHGHRTGQCA
jgi:hypothetical protein